MIEENKKNHYSTNKVEMSIIPLTGNSLNSQIETGCYQVELKHEDVVAAGLPLSVCDNEHYIIGYLFVSELGCHGALQSDRVIGQTLLLNDCKGNSPAIYRRQWDCSKGATRWENWGKLQQNIEVGQVDSLNEFADSGVYSGVYTHNELSETFVMVVINNYAVAAATGNERCISQFKYALNVNGTFSYMTRTGRGNTTIVWGEWVDLGAADTTDIQDGAITKQKLSSDVAVDIAKSANDAYWTSDLNAVTLNINKNDGTTGWQTLPAATTEKAGVMSAEDKVALMSKVVKICAFAVSNAEANKILTEIGQIYYCTNPASGAYRQLQQATGGEVGNFTYSRFPIRQDAVYVYDEKIYVYNGTELVLAGEDWFAKNTAFEVRANSTGSYSIMWNGTTLLNVNSAIQVESRLSNVESKIVKISAFAVSNTEANKILTEIGQIYYCTNPASGAYRQLQQATGGEVGNFTYSRFPIRQDAVYVYDGKIYIYDGTELVLADNEILTGLEGRVSELENNQGGEKEDIVSVNISYIGETHDDIISNIGNGEAGLCYRFTSTDPQAIIRKDNNGEVTIEKGAANLLKYRYIIEGQEFVFVNVKNNTWYLQLVEVREDRRLKSISQHKIELLDELPSCEAWNTEDVDGINRVMFDVYDKFDELIKANPDVITKYDPMATADVVENGVTVKKWDDLRKYMADYGFSDYPIYAKGITEGTYTIGDYTKDILTTPAYKTYIYKISEPDYKKLDYGGTLCEKRVLYVQAGCHAPEYAGPIAAYNFAKILLSNGNGAKSLLSQFDVYILPVIDGYANIHRKYAGALGVNVNRNYPTAFWRPLGADYGLVAGDQFPTRIVCGIIDIIKPDVAIDLHDYTERADSLGITHSCYTRTTALLQEVAIKTGNMLTNVERLRSDYFGAKGKNPIFIPIESLGNLTTAKMYFFHKKIKCSALLELPSTINFTPTEDGGYTIGTRMETQFSADTNSVAASLVTNFAYLMCQYNLNEF